MKQLFILLDTSGSVLLEGRSKIGQINDTLRDMLVAAEGKYTSAYLIVYADMPRIYWSSKLGTAFEDLTTQSMDGRSNLGKAYYFIKDIMTLSSTEAKDACVVLMTDGESTDNYTKALKEIDPNNEMTRIAVGLGSGYEELLENHATDRALIFTDIGNSITKDELIDEVLLNLA